MRESKGKQRKTRGSRGKQGTQGKARESRGKQGWARQSMEKQRSGNAKVLYCIPLFDPVCRQYSTLA